MRASTIRAAVWTLALVVAAAVTAEAAPLRVMPTGLGSGRIQASAATPPLDCGAGASACSGDYTGTVTLTATADAGSTIAGWDGNCVLPAGTTSCTVPMTEARAVRVKFDLAVPPDRFTDLSPDGIRTYLLSADPGKVALTTPARFVAALPDEFRHNWLLMTRSESLQPGVAASPRVLLPSADATRTFTLALGTHSSYPGAHPNAIEYMQWDPLQKNFRFHEIVVAPIPDLGCTRGGVYPPQPVACGTAGATAPLFPARSRGISIDDEKCPKCHSTRNVPNLDRTLYPAVPGTGYGTDGIPPGTVRSKNKPNWDTYDSWGGLLGFNRDRIYQGSVEAAAFRTLFNPWTWATKPEFGRVFEQLALQPPVAGIPTEHIITRQIGGADDGQVHFPFDGDSVIVTREPSPGDLPTSAVDPIFGTTVNSSVTYNFNRLVGALPGSQVITGGKFVTLHHSEIPGSDEGRGVHYFDELGGAVGGPLGKGLNQQRIADEVIEHHFATGSVPIDVRPLALAIRKGCYTRVPGSPDAVNPPLAGGVGFFTARHRRLNRAVTPAVMVSMTLDDIFADTLARQRSLPRRKADIQKLNLDRTNDNYLDNTAAQVGLIQEFGGTTLPAPGTSTTVERLRQEVFRRPTGGFGPDTSEIGGDYVDREDYTVSTVYNTEQIALYRYFLEPLGVSVDKWSMGVRGRSRTYTFADVLNDSPYTSQLEGALVASLSPASPTNPDGRPFDATLTDPTNCGQLTAAVDRSLVGLVAADLPKYTDVQRIFNKGCIECHGGQGYPPFSRYFDVTYLDLSEEEGNTVDRTARSHGFATSFTSANALTSYLFQLVVRTAEDCDFNGTTGVFQMMPCGGPPLSAADVGTLERWIDGGRLLTWGDPHLTTIDGVHYDFQATGELTLIRDEELEIQARQSAVSTEGPLGPDAYTGLTSCVSLNTAAAIRLGQHRISYQPRPGQAPSPEGLALLVDGKEVPRPTTGALVLAWGARIVPTGAPGGLQILYPGGTDIVITPGWWEHYRVWYLDLDVRHVRASDGVMGKIARGSWLPALPDGRSVGPLPDDLGARYKQLYGTFAEAWRVTDATSLFTYGPGESSRSSITPGWPGLSPQTCVVPPRSEKDPPGPAPLRTLTAEAATRACAGLLDPARRTDCEADVRVTGEVTLAKTYKVAEAIAYRTPPSPPELVAPAPDQHDLPAGVTFTWKPSGPAGLTYLHCVWPQGTAMSFAQCVELPRPTAPLGGHRDQLLIALLVLLLLLLILIVRARRRGALVLLALVVAVLLALVFYLGRGKPVTQLSREVAGLQPGKAYFWKVVAQDGKGGLVESETRRLAIK